MLLRLVAPLTLIALALTGCSSSVKAAPSLKAQGGGGCSYVSDGTAAKHVQPPQTDNIATSGTVTFTLAMTGGDVTITGDRAKTPCTLNSFESLAEQKYFDGTKCHRLADSGMFMVQCGDPTGTGRGGPGYQFADELTGTETYPAGTVAMANSGPDTNGSQFFIVYGDTSLAPNYTVFGTVDAASLKVIEKMASEGHDDSWGGGTGKPKNAFEIKSVSSPRP